MVHEEVIENIKSTPTWEMEDVYYQAPKKSAEEVEAEENLNTEGKPVEEEQEVKDAEK